MIVVGEAVTRNTTFFNSLDPSKVSRVPGKFISFTALLCRGMLAMSALSVTPRSRLAVS